MKYKIVYLLLALFGLSGYQASQAVVVEELFTVEMAVADQTTSVRLEAFGEAFKLVVIKVSGSDDALQSPAFSRPMQSSARYVRQFKYINRKDENSEGFDSGQLFLKIDFNQRLIEDLLRENNFPVWGQERPGSLLVVSYDVNENIRLVSGDSTPDVVELIDEAAANQGVPVIFPLMDLEDIALINIGDIVSRQYENIDVLADRYGPDVLVIGQVVGRSGQGWHGDWEVRFDEQVFKWKYKGSSKQQVIEQAVKHLARVLALGYAPESYRRVDQALLISVSAMPKFNQMISVQRYLESLSVVDSARVSMVSGDQVTFELKLRNDAEDLQRLIELGEVLEQLDLPQVDAQADSQVILNYLYIDRGVSN